MRISIIGRANALLQSRLRHAPNVRHETLSLVETEAMALDRRIRWFGILSHLASSMG